jgi:hypothetical protein
VKICQILGMLGSRLSTCRCHSLPVLYDLTGALRHTANFVRRSRCKGAPRVKTKTTRSDGMMLSSEQLAAANTPVAQLSRTQPGTRILMKDLLVRPQAAAAIHPRRVGQGIYTSQRAKPITNAAFFCATNSRRNGTSKSWNINALQEMFRCDHKSMTSSGNPAVV